jgi:hypothetical protein
MAHGMLGTVSLTKIIDDFRKMNPTATLPAPLLPCFQWDKFIQAVTHDDISLLELRRFRIPMRYAETMREKLCMRPDHAVACTRCGLVHGVAAAAAAAAETAVAAAAAAAEMAAMAAAAAAAEMAAMAAAAAAAEMAAMAAAAAAAEMAAMAAAAVAAPPRRRCARRPGPPP